jgi:hypothetical protein
MEGGTGGEMAQTELALGGHKSACEIVGQYKEASEAGLKSCG